MKQRLNTENSATWGTVLFWCFALVTSPLSGCAESGQPGGRVCTIDAQCASGDCLPNGTCAEIEADAASNLEDASDSGTADAGRDVTDGDAAKADLPTAPDSDIGEPDQGPNNTCRPNRDGVIEAREVPLRAGYEANFEITTAIQSFDTRPECDDGTCVWNLVDIDGETQDRVLITEPVDGRWFAEDPAFAGATYTSKLAEFNMSFLFLEVCNQVQYGVFQVTDDALLLLGLVSETVDGDTKLVYDPPLPMLRFPLEEGASWTAETTSTGSLCGSMFDYNIDQTLTADVDATGTVQTPYGDFENVLRVNTLLVRHLGVGVLPTRVRSHMFVAECFTTVATIASEEGEDEPEFDNISEVRALSLFE